MKDKQVDLIIKGRKRDLGGFNVVRSIPHAKKRFVGPFIFLDHMGPLKVSNERRLDVGPHPHIGLSTVTYLFSGKILHRDSLGSVQMISPGELNWMTAGKGIVHSEVTPDEEMGNSIHGIQIWVALPKEFEKEEASFTHYKKESLPEIELVKGLKGRLLVGNYKKSSSPVKVYSKMIFIEAQAQEDLVTTLRIDEKEVGIFLVEGTGRVNTQELEEDDLIVISEPQQIELILEKGSRIVIIGGTPLPEPRYIWWNFVSSNKDDLQKAAKEWKEDRFPKINVDQK